MVTVNGLSGMICLADVCCESHIKEILSHPQTRLSFQNALVLESHIFRESHLSDRGF